MRARERASVLGLAGALGVVALLVVLPTHPLPSDGTVVEPTPSAAPIAGDTYREGILGSWSSVTPISARTPAERAMVSLVFSGLVRHAPGPVPTPDLATSWASDRSGGTWTITLRPDAVWQDGAPVTSADVVFTYETLQDPEYDGPQGASWRDVVVSAVDPLTVRFSLTAPLGGFLDALAQPLLPEHLLRGQSAQEIATGPFSKAPVGSGRFRVVSLDATSAVLDRSSGTASPSAGGGEAAASSPIGRIELHFYDAELPMRVDFETGALDAMVGLPAASVASYGGTSETTGTAGTTGTSVVLFPTTTLTVVVPNQRGSTLASQKPLRLALSAAIDRNALVQTTLLGQAVRANGLIPTSSWAFSPKSTPTIRFDRTAATTVLKKAGWKYKNGWYPKGSKKRIALQVIAPDASTNSTAYAVAKAVVAAWKGIGFAVRLTPLDPLEFGSRLQTGKFSLAVVSVNLGHDPDLYPFLGSTQARQSGSNVAGVQNAALDKLLIAARKPGSTAARLKAYAALQRFLSSEQFILPLFYRDEAMVLSGRVQGVVPRAISQPGERFDDVLTWRLARGR